MANELTWFTEPNHVISDFSTAAKCAHSTLWMVKALLKGEVGTDTNGLWTCFGSSDSVTANITGTDLLGTGAFDDTKWVRAAAASPHTWIVLKSPTSGSMTGGPYYMIIDYSATSDQAVNIVFCKATPTGGTTSARPTSTDEWIHIANTAFIENGTNSHKLSIVKTTSGAFCMYVVKTGLGLVPGTLGIVELTETISGDTYPVVSWVAAYAIGGSTLIGNHNSNGAGNPSPCKAQRWDGTVKLDISWTQTCFINGTQMSAASANNGLNAQDNSYSSFPVYAFAYIGAGSLGTKGRLQDIRYSGTASGSLTTGAVSPPISPFTSVFVGTGLNMPWTGAVAMTT